MSNDCIAELRLAERDAFCRACDIKITKGTYMISFYSWRNRGQNIHLCLNCCSIIGDMVNEPKKSTIGEERIVLSGIPSVVVPDNIVK